MSYPIEDDQETDQSMPEDDESFVHYDPDQNDLLDIHVGNPLTRITKLLEDIKKQKAFSFTLKGSLGVMGVVLIFSTFGLFGGSKLLCEKGRQTHQGKLIQLTTNDHAVSTLPLIGPVIDYYNMLMHPDFIARPKKRIILQTANAETIYIPHVNLIYYDQALGNTVLITGSYDSCSKTLRPQSQEDVEVIIPSL